MEWKRDLKSNKKLLETLVEFRGILVSISLPLFLTGCLPSEISVSGVKDKVSNPSFTADLTSVPTPGDTFMNVSVGGDRVVSYIYKTGTGSLDCSDPNGYSTDIPVTTPITDPIGPDGTKKSVSLPQTKMEKNSPLPRLPNTHGQKILLLRPL